MPRLERQQQVMDLLNGLRAIEPLKKLFWEELNYQRVNQPLSRRGWAESAGKALADDPVLFAGGGEDNAFHVIYCRLASNSLARGLERPVATQLLREHPYALFVFSNTGQTDWHFLNVKFDDQAESRRLFRRITVRPDAGLRTATERLQLLDLTEIHPELFGITPLAIQQRCDAAFDVETVTKDFFREIANWYFWALKNVRFPKDAPKEADGHDHISVIRLITRLIFCWFVKEKGLIPDTLFDERKLAQTLTGFAPQDSSPLPSDGRGVRGEGSVFYKAILQNLFFATLNTEMDNRAWRKDDNNFMAHILYRHRALFQKPNEALDLFKNIPFLNGGLFECLDKREGTKESPKDTRIDGFSDRGDSQPIVPDFFFFGGEREVDLSADYNDAKFRRVPVRGLIHIFDRYNFTVEENTPIEQEVALDPELSGKVFENLLAAYNPETGATARKQTGSFYTPREIVNYMVDEALIACLKTKLEAALPTAKDVEARLRHLFAYNDEPHKLTALEVDVLIAAIGSLKSLDPAVGSSAFPMGILHKLVFILGKLDPRNEKWKERQIARVQDTMATAEKIEDATARERALRELEQQIIGINEAFEHNELDYGRKLYLIENCIYGVDIQPIAVQIAKMRFFISLIVDQKIDDSQPNRGVRPLPNLETKFVAANTLIGVNRPGQQLLRNRDIDAKEAELRRVRERYFLARTPKQKSKCRDDDARLRTEIAELLKGDGWDTATARKLASWNPYDQNTTADFFDAERMFGLTAGFDVAIGNPPYLNVELVSAAQKIYFAEHYQTFYKRFDVFGLFFECSLCKLVTKGIVAFIIPAQIFNNLSYKKLRALMLTNHWLREVLYLGDKIFTAASNDVCVLFLDTSGVSSIRLVNALNFESPTVMEVPATHFEQFGGIISVSSSARGDNIASKIFYPGAERVRQHFEVFQGIVTGNNPVYLPEPEEIAAAKLERKLMHTVLHGRDFEKWRIHNPSRLMLYVDSDTDLKKFPNAEKWLLLHRSELETRRECVNGVISWYSLQWPRKKELLNVIPKIVVQATRNPRLKDRIVAALDEEGCYGTQGVNFIVPTTDRAHPKPLLALLNFSLVNWLFQTRFLNVAIKAEYLKDLPLPPLTVQRTKKLTDLVDRILAAKRKNPSADTSALEREIDQQVCALYGLTPEEIKIVEEATKS